MAIVFAASLGFFHPAAINAQIAQAEAAEITLETGWKEMIDSIVIKHAIKNQCRITASVVETNGKKYYFGYDGRSGEGITDFSKSIDIGSCSKIFTATAILQLIEQGKFNLGSRLVDVYPDRALYGNLVKFEDKDYTDEVCIFHLLNHTSGFPDYFYDDDDIEIKLHGDSTLVFTPQQLIRLADRLYEPELKPGEKFKYSNVNYILLGLIIEKYSGLPYQQYIQEHILDPLSLDDTYFSSLGSRAGRSPGFYKTKPAQMPPTMAWSAGEIVSTLDDMTAFMKAWHEGKLFKNPSTIEQVREAHFNSMGMGVRYGLGVIDLSGKAYGHGGQTFGFSSFIGVVPNGARFAMGCDDANADTWVPAIRISSLLAK